MRNLTSRQIILILGAALTVATLAVGVYGLVRGPRSTDPEPELARDPGREAAVRIAPAAPAPAAGLEDRALPSTIDPIVYARAVATSLFDWDTAAGYLPTDYTVAVTSDADPSGEETPGLISDVATYLPSLAQWLDLGAMKVTQTLEIDQAYVPDAWAAALEQAHGQIRPGTTAVTITGTRSRRGVWNDRTAQSASQVSFTVFVACAPSFDRCHVLRLSELDNPLR